MTKKRNTKSNSSMPVRKKPVILAIDPGTKHLGFAHFTNSHLVDCGVRTIAQGDGLRDIFVSIDTVVSRFFEEKKPDIFVMENNHFSQISQNLRLAIAIARMKKIAAKHKVPVVEVHPRTVRRVVCNNGNASKRELARTVAVLIPTLKPYLKSNTKWREQYYFNMFDAVGCGLAYLKDASVRRKGPTI